MAKPHKKDDCGQDKLDGYTPSTENSLNEGNLKPNRA